MEKAGLLAGGTEITWGSKSPELEDYVSHVLSLAQFPEVWGQVFS